MRTARITQEGITRALETLIHRRERMMEEMTKVSFLAHGKRQMSLWAPAVGGSRHSKPLSKRVNVFSAALSPRAPHTGQGHARGASWGMRWAHPRPLPGRSRHELGTLRHQGIRVLVLPTPQCLSCRDRSALE